MTSIGWLQILIYAITIFIFVKPLGNYMFRVFEGERQPMPRFFGPMERWIYKLCGVDPKDQQDWKQYTLALLVFSCHHIAGDLRASNGYSRFYPSIRKTWGRFRRTSHLAPHRASPPIRTGRPTAANRP